MIRLSTLAPNGSKKAPNDLSSLQRPVLDHMQYFLRRASTVRMEHDTVRWLPEVPHRGLR